MPDSTNILRRIESKSSPSAWKSFFDNYHGLVQGVAARMGMSEADQKEVVQETMIAAHRNLKPRAMKGPQARAWLRTVSRRKIMDLLRKVYRRGREVAFQEGDEPVYAADVELDQAWEDEWRLNLLERALDRLRVELPPKMYQAFDLFAIREHDAEQVAKTLGISRGLVYLYKLRVTEKLRKEIQRLGKEAL